MDDWDLPLVHRELYEDDTFELGALVTLGEDPVSSFGFGSRIGRSPNLRRDFDAAHQQIVADYFSDTLVYGSKMFQRRFRMSRELFLRICDEMKDFDPQFERCRDALGKPGLSTLQKCTAAVRMLAYGVSADAVDEYIKIGESSAN